jgi:hypothetical protein
MITQRWNSFLPIVIATSFFALGGLTAGTIPAGTVIPVKTLDSIYTKDAVGRQFMAKLDGDLSVKGKVLLPSGTQFVGKIITSTKIGNSPLSVDLTGIKLHGKVISLKTTGAYEPTSVTRGGRRQVSSRDFVLPVGSKMQFHLAQSLTI